MPLTVYPDPQVVRGRFPPLDAATLGVFEALVTELSDDPEPWEMFVRPLLLNHHPDLLLACPRYGVIVIEVRDWHPDEWRVDDGTLKQHKKTDGQPARWETVPTHRGDLLSIVHDERSLLSGTYLTPPGQAQRFREVRGVVVLPRWPDDVADLLLRASTELSDDAAKWIPVMGASALTATRRLAMGGGTVAPHGLPERWLERLRDRLTGSEARRLAGQPLELSRQAKEIKTNQNRTARRMVIGPAGSGKSVALAARAATLAAEGRSVLVLSFNITLGHYLSTLITRHANELGTTLDKVDVMHFHRFEAKFKRHEKMKKSRPGHEAPRYEAPRYEAILVDEGQDFNVEWWEFLRDEALDTSSDHNEMLLTLDETQTIYGDKDWRTGRNRTGMGFRGPPMRLEESYRLSPDLIAVMYDYAKQFMADKQPDLPTVPPERRGRAIPPSFRVWRDVGRENLHDSALSTVRALVKNPNINPADLVVIASHHTGLRLMSAIEDELGIDVEHIFTEEDDDERRNRKLAFFPTVDALKGVTVHSYKGWESSLLLLLLDEGMTHQEGHSDIATLGYIALTRLLAPPAGRRAAIIVLNSHPQLAGFKETFEREVSAEEAEALSGQLAMPSDDWALGTTWDDLPF